MALRATGSWECAGGKGGRSEGRVPPYLHHLLAHVDDVQPVVEAGVAVELGGAVAQGHAQLALPLPVDVVNQLHLGTEHKP